MRKECRNIRGLPQAVGPAWGSKHFGLSSRGYLVKSNAVCFLDSSWYWRPERRAQLSEPILCYIMIYYKEWTIRVLPKVVSFWQMPGFSESKQMQLIYLEVSSVGKARWLIISCSVFCVFWEISTVGTDAMSISVASWRESLTGQLMHITEDKPVSLLFEDNCTWQSSACL